MSLPGGGNLHPPTVDDVRRLLDCVSAVHLAVAIERPRVLAERLVNLLNGSVVAVDAGMVGETRRVATAAAAPALPRWTAVVEPVAGLRHPTGEPTPPRAGKAAPAATGPAATARGTSRGPASAPLPKHEVSLLTPSLLPGTFSDVRPAGVQSIYQNGDHLSAITAWRAEPFESRHLMLLDLVHPPLAWIFGVVPARTGLPVSTEAVLELMRRGMPEKEIAHRLGRSAHTVHAHVKRVYRHYAVRSRPELLARLYETAQK
ncbi:MAG: Transcriptional regulator, LuxR family protein [Phycisphaerales bacterium]|nr:Transcriptional regulator, LuxR family protein [Phycisphaerales bacterium]